MRDRQIFRRKMMKWWIHKNQTMKLWIHKNQRHSNISMTKQHRVTSSTIKNRKFTRWPANSTTSECYSHMTSLSNNFSSPFGSLQTMIVLEHFLIFLIIQYKEVKITRDQASVSFWNLQQTHISGSDSVLHLQI